MEDPLLRAQRRRHAILCNQRIEDQSAIDTAEYGGFL
jgi:hypothetical protein